MRINDDQEPVIARVQVSYFNYGGLVIGIRISHKIADRIGLSSFFSPRAANSVRISI